MAPYFDLTECRQFSGKKITKPSLIKVHQTQTNQTGFVSSQTERLTAKTFSCGRSRSTATNGRPRTQQQSPRAAGRTKVSFEPRAAGGDLCFAQSGLRLVVSHWDGEGWVMCSRSSFVLTTRATVLPTGPAEKVMLTTLTF